MACDYANRLISSRHIIPDRSRSDRSGIHKTNLFAAATLESRSDPRSAGNDKSDERVPGRATTPSKNIRELGGPSRGKPQPSPPRRDFLAGERPSLSLVRTGVRRRLRLCCLRRIGRLLRLDCRLITLDGRVMEVARQRRRYKRRRECAAHYEFDEFRTHASLRFGCQPPEL